MYACDFSSSHKYAELSKSDKIEVMQFETRNIEFIHLFELLVTTCQ